MLKSLEFKLKKMGLTPHINGNGYVITNAKNQKLFIDNETFHSMGDDLKNNQIIKDFYSN